MARRTIHALEGHHLEENSARQMWKQHAGAFAQRQDTVCVCVCVFVRACVRMWCARSLACCAREHVFANAPRYLGASVCVAYSRTV